MYAINCWFCLVVVGGVWATSQSDCDLQLDRIFRTPKDFSRVNFDHFEILERNNFADGCTPAVTQTKECANLDHPPKSVANAQVMLRFGGDNIRDCSGIPVGPRQQLVETVPTLASRSVPIMPCPPPVPCASSGYGYPAYPTYVSAAPAPPQVAYAYPPPPSDFSRCYYGVGTLQPSVTLQSAPLPQSVRTAAVQTVPETGCGQVVSADRVIDSPINFLQVYPEETADFLECDRPPRAGPYAESQSVQEILVPTGQYIERETRLPAGENANACATERVCITGPKVVEEVTVGQPAKACNAKPGQEVVEVVQCPCCEQHGACGCNRDRNPDIPFGRRFLKDVDSLLDIPAVDDYASDAVGVTEGAEPCVAREVLAPVSSLPRVINQVVNVPNMFSCHDCVSGFPTPRVINQVVSVPHSVYGGYRTTCQRFVTSAIPSCDKDEPSVVVDECETSAGGEFYADPQKSVIYKEPTVTKIVSVENPGSCAPVVEETKIVEPQLFKVIPRDDIACTGGDQPANIPDLVPTNKYICAKCTNMIPREVCQREVLPVVRRVPVVNDAGAAWPVIRNEAYVRQTPVVANYVPERYCPSCARYEGELNELTPSDC